MPDLFTGTMTLEVPLLVPSGRGGMTPALVIRYRSTHANSWIGIGWDLRTGAIERDTLKGLDFSADAYVLDDGYARTTLLATGGGRYAPQIEASFFRIRKLPADDGRSFWEVTTKDGTQYLYGRTAGARLDDPSGANRIFSWRLETVRDTHGNTIPYEYEKVSSPSRESYLKTIRYSAREPLPAPHVITFNREDRNDVWNSYAAGFPSRISQRLSTIDISSLNHLQRRYQLRYDGSETAGASRLIAVTETGRDAHLTL